MNFGGIMGQIRWPEFIFPPINLWSAPYANKSRCWGVGMEECCIPKPRPDRDTGNSQWLRSTHTQSEYIWSTLKTYR